MDLEDEAVLAGDTVALRDLRQALREVRDLGELPRRRAHAHEAADREPKRARLDGDTPAKNASLLEALQPLAHGRCRHLHAPREFRNREPRAVAQQANERDVLGIVEQVSDLKARGHIGFQNEGTFELYPSRRHIHAILWD